LTYAASLLDAATPALRMALNNPNGADYTFALSNVGVAGR
jgi:hypothetical protein